MIRRILGIVFAVGGIIMLLFSNYIYEQIGEGNRKISRAQKQVDTGNAFLSLTPESKKIGEHLTGPIQQKIDDGRATVEEYEVLAERLHIGGIVLIIVGAGLFIISFINRRKRSKR